MTDNLMDERTRAVVLDGKIVELAKLIRYAALRLLNAANEVRLAEPAELEEARKKYLKQERLCEGILRELEVTVNGNSLK